MFIGEIEEIGMIEPVSVPEETPREEPATPLDEPVAA